MQDKICQAMQRGDIEALVHLAEFWMSRPRDRAWGLVAAAVANALSSDGGE